MNRPFKPRKRILIPRVFTPSKRLYDHLEHNRRRQQAEGVTLNVARTLGISVPEARAMLAAEEHKKCTR